MSRLVDIEKLLQKYDDYESFTGHSEYDEGVDSGVLLMVDELENLPVINNKRVKSIIRCEECVLKHYSSSSNLWCDVFDRIMPEDGFCCFGDNKK